MFRANYNNIVKSLLPSKNRKPKFKAFIGVMLTGVKNLYFKFISIRRKNLYDLQHLQHIAHLECVLNDEFDMSFRRIKIVDAPVQYEPRYLFQDAENKQKATFTDAENNPTPLFTDYEIDNEGLDFVVKLPITIPYNFEKMTALLEKYKTPGMAYIIEETL